MTTCNYIHDAGGWQAFRRKLGIEPEGRNDHKHQQTCAKNRKKRKSKK